MNREDAQQWAKLYQAYADGETIQVLTYGRWCDLASASFTRDLKFYRVKPKLIPKRYTVHKNDAGDIQVSAGTRVNPETYLGAIDLILDPETDKFEVKIVDGHDE